LPSAGWRASSAPGVGKPDWKLAWKRLVNVVYRMATFQPVFRFRFWSSLFHGLVGWGLIFYVLVNLVEVAKGFYLDLSFRVW